MTRREEVAALRKPSAAMTAVASAGLAVAWIGLRVVLFNETLFPLTYVLPLMLSVWTRSTTALWLMAAAFAIAQTIRQFVAPASVSASQNWIVYGGTLVNILVGAGVVHLVVAFRGRLEASNSRLHEALEQVEAQAEELASQNEELTQQSEELSRQTEQLTAQNAELQVHAEEIESLTDEVRAREGLLQALLDSARLASGEKTALEDVARAALGMFRERAAAVAVYESRDGRIELRAVAGDVVIAPAPPPALVDFAVQENRAASLDDASLRPDLVASSATRSVGAVLCAPIRVADAPTGAICVFSAAAHQWTAEQFRLVEWLAAQCAHILQILRMNADLRRKEEALRNSERLYRAIGESIPYGVWVCDPDGRNVYASESFLRLVGITQQECSDFGWGSVLHPDDAERTVAAWKECARTGGVWDIEHRYRGVDGKYHPVLARGVAVRDERGKIVCWAGINLDISGPKQAEAALVEANRTKDEFLATLSHELRTPLNAIVGWSQMLLSGKLDEAATRRAIEIIARNGEAQNRLIEDVLDVSRIVSGKLRLDAEPTDLVPVLETVVESMLLAANAKGVEIRRDFQARSAIVLADAARLQQVFWNLLANAVKFTPSGGFVEVRLEASDSTVVVRVHDTGNGIRPEFLPHVFERFAQHDHSTSRLHTGLGLGLAIVRHLTELHGGTVAAESEGIGHGSTFTVTLPARSQAGALQLRDAMQWEPGGDQELRGLRVLVVDDEAEARELFRTVLTRAGAQVTVATSAAEAFDCLSRMPMDLLVSDIGMPGTDGYSLITEIRARGNSIPAIAVTAYGRPEEAARAIAAGFQIHLSKPTLPGQLVAAAGRLRRERTAR